jgi:hypothetical protein
MEPCCCELDCCQNSYCLGFKRGVSGRVKEMGNSNGDEEISDRLGDERIERREMRLAAENIVRRITFFSCEGIKRKKCDVFK